jgi:anthranilate phosphoribosyltransferase
MQGQLCMLQGASSIKQGVMMAEDAIHSGLALEKLAALRDFSRTFIELSA